LGGKEVLEGDNYKTGNYAKLAPPRPVVESCAEEEGTDKERISPRRLFMKIKARAKGYVASWNQALAFPKRPWTIV